MWQQLLLVVSFVPSTLGQSFFLSYLFLTPAEVHYPSTEAAYLHVSGVREKVNVTITLQCGVVDHILFQEEVNPPGLCKSIKFQTLPPEGGAEEVVSVHISLIGPNLQISESKNILVCGVGSFTLIQTDKPIYKQGETVRIRIVTFDRDFLAINDICPLVEIQDPNKNRIRQWLNLRPQKGIIDLSHSLDSEAQLGAYIIISPNAHQFFHVSEYVVPNFEVVIKLPSVVSITDKSIPIKTCGRYTFGKPIQGEIDGKLCRKASCFYWHYWSADTCPTDVCIGYKGRTDKNGCLEVEIETEPFHLQSYDYQLNFDSEASLVEDGTGVQMNATSSCHISAMIAKVTFEELEVSDSFYKPGLKYKTKMKLVSADGSTMKSQTLYLTEKYDGVTKEHVYETDENGKACITLDTNPWNRHTVFLSASYKKNKPVRTYGQLNPYFVDAHQILQPFGTTTNSFIKIQPLAETLSCDRVHQLEIEYIIRGSELVTDEDHLDLYYVVVAKGDLVFNGQMKISIKRNSVTMGTVELPLMVTVNIAPTANILVYALLGNGKIVADTEQFQVTKCFNNKVTLNFSKHEASPGSNVTLHVNAYPGSLCSVRAVDEGVLFMRPEAEISSEAAYHFLLQRNQHGYPYRVREDDAICWNPGIFPFYKGGKQSLDWSTPTDPDVFTLIKNLGLKIITNMQIKKPLECPNYPPVAALSTFGGHPFGSHVSSVQSYIEPDTLDDVELRVTMTVHELTKKIRKMFPETWIWDLVTVGTSGQTDLQVHLPDTITEWKTMAFCMGDVGLGIAPTTSMTAFQPFFSDLALPYSAIRGEAFTCTATVYNYMPKPLMVKVSLEDSPELEVMDCPTCSTPQCVYPEQTKVFIWEAKALRTGSAKIVMSTEAINTEVLCNGEQPIVPENDAADSLMKTVLIKAEGMPVEIFYNSILCGGDFVSSENVTLALPPVMVPESASAVFTVVGDIMGSALQGIEKLLVPNIFLMDYLVSSNQLTEEIQQLGQKYIMHGYERELNYQREDGSFSAFGEKDKEGSTWLTAYVMKSISAASRYIHVDNKCIQKSVNWLKENQLPSGSFRNRGKLFKASLKGGVVDEVTLNAFVTLSLLETRQLLQNELLENEMLQNVLQWLRSIAFQVDSLYTKAMLAYTFTLSEDYEIREALLLEMHEKAVKTAGETYWPSNLNNPSKESSWSQANSNEVETASYIVLAHLSVDAPTTQDIKEASSICHWIARQQTPYGGFKNTQDTVLGLQGLAQYSKITYTRHGVLEVLLSQDGDNFLHHLQVDEDTRLLQQKIQLKELPGKYNVQVKGVGCAFIQITLRYNMYTAKVSPFFDLQINITAEDSEDKFKYHLLYTISVRYTGPRNVTNMVLLETELPSGFSAWPESLLKLYTHPLVRRTETPENKVVVYITELCKEAQNFTFSAKQDFMVQNQKSRFIKVYDYYETEEEASMIYYVPNQ